MVLSESDETDAYKGHQYITTANKIYTLHHMDDKNDEIGMLNESLRDFETLSEKARAVIYGHRGFLYSHFGTSNKDTTTEAFKESMELDPENYLWPLGLALAEERFRKLKEGTRTLTTDSEEMNLREAVELSGQQKALPMAMLAELLYHDARVDKNDPKNEARIKEARKWFEKAHQMSPRSQEVLGRYGQFLNIEGDQEKGKKMLKEACELNPYNSHYWFRLGQAYRFSDIQELEKAEESYGKAVTEGHVRHFRAEMDLGWVRNKTDHSYDIIQHFEGMRIHYQSDDDKQKILDEKIENVKDDYSRRYEQSRSRGSRGPRRQYGNYRSQTGNREKQVIYCLFKGIFNHNGGN